MFPEIPSAEQIKTEDFDTEFDTETGTYWLRVIYVAENRVFVADVYPLDENDDIGDGREVIGEDLDMVIGLLEEQFSQLEAETKGKQEPSQNSEGRMLAGMERGNKGLADYDGVETDDGEEE